jgi:hypothetical protein
MLFHRCPWGVSFCVRKRRFNDRLMSLAVVECCPYLCQNLCQYVDLIMRLTMAL